MVKAEPEAESLEALQARHRKEQRDLVSRITQKKKLATKKTRKGVNDDCERWEREQKERQEAEVAALVGAEQDHDETETNTGATPASELSEGSTNLNFELTTEAARKTITSGGAATGAGRTKKPNRAKARLARRAAEQDAIIRDAEVEAANAPDPRALERERMAEQIQKHNLRLYEIRADGHCLYAAVADQLHTRELNLKPRIRRPASVVMEGESVPTYKTIRDAAADWIQAHGNDFAGFMEDPLPEHVRKIRDTGEWGGHLELLALACTYSLEICILHSDGHIDRIKPEEHEAESTQIWLGYFKHSHGLGEHYNSLRKAG